MQTQIPSTKKSKRGVNVKSDVCQVFAVWRKHRYKHRPAVCGKGGRGYGLKESMGRGLTYLIRSGSKQEESQDKGHC